jgi:branched-chain amino acid transport system substrate-binding protein
LKYGIRLLARGVDRLAILALLALGACAPGQTQPATGASTSSPNEISIAVVGPVTGDLADFGVQMREAAKLAGADINAAGGVLGKSVRLVIEDDQCDPGHASAVAREVVKQMPVAVIGHFCSGVSIPASRIYFENGILQITPASSNPRFTDEAAAKGWATVFRTCARDDQQGVVAADYLVGHYDKDRIALLQDDSGYAQVIEPVLLKALAARGSTPVFQAQIHPGLSSYQRVIDELIKARPDAIYFMGYHPEAALLVKESRASGVQAAFMGPDSLMTTDFAQQAGAAAEGVMFTSNHSALLIPQPANLIAQLRVAGVNPERGGADYAVFTYAAFQEFAMAAQRAETFDAQALAKALRAGSFDTVMGSVTFDEKGDLRQQVFSWYRFRAGNFELVP